MRPLVWYDPVRDEILTNRILDFYFYNLMGEHFLEDYVLLGEL